MLRKAVSKQLALLIFLIFVLCGCATTLAPQYDKALVDGLTSSNTATMEFLASVSGGTQKTTFDQRKEKYSNIIGRFDALAIQAGARPMPRNKVVEAIGGLLSKKGIPVPDDTVAPSASAMTKISGTFAKMRDTDEKQGVTAIEVQAFKNQVSIYLDQAFTYESFLER